VEQLGITYKERGNKKQLQWEVNKKTGCWEVISHVAEKANGYVFLKHNGIRIRAHRYVWIITHGDIREGFLICHTCHNRICVNPDHLYMGTRIDNTQDMMRDGRFNFGKRRKGTFTLTPQQVKEIRESTLSSYKLAELYPVTDVQIRRIRNGTRCKNVQ
jgi:hypothetical protein